MSEYTEFLNRWAANSERLHRIGIHPHGYDPGFACRIKDVYRTVEIPEKLADIICGLVKKVYPETESDKAMITAYKKRIKANLAAQKKHEKPGTLP